MVLVLLVLGLASCGEYEVLEVQKECQRKADSLFMANKKDLIGKFEKICDNNSDKYYQTALDSLRDTRITDIKNLIEK
jgi:hypothetical protein